MTTGEYLTKQEVLALLKVSRSILEDLMKQGLPHIKFKRRVLFRRKDLDDFIQKHHLVR
jgi:excisionase family DNA binding protein